MVSTTKTKLAKTNTATLLPQSRARRILLTAAILLSLLGSYWIIRWNIILPRQERASFKQADDQINTALQRISDKTVSKSRFCTEAQQEFGRGPLGCAIKVRIKVSQLKTGVGRQDVFTALRDSGFDLKNPRINDDEGFFAETQHAQINKVNCYFMYTEYKYRKDEPFYDFSCSGAATKNINWN